MDINLLEKTELWIENITLTGADLNRIAAVAADVLGLEPSKVLVVDVRYTHVTLDILQPHIKAEQVFGKKAELLWNLSLIPGVQVTEETEIHSDGILGMIALSEEEARQAVERSSALAADVMNRVARRAYVYPTGFEVKGGMIRDTNTPYIRGELEAHGFTVQCGSALDDDLDLIAGKLRRTVNEGYGLIVTTGGVGAESKDRTVEAIMKLDADAATPYIVHFTQGTGRHEKDGVKIAVGKVDHTTIVALPGPNDEVKTGLSVILEGLEKGWGKEQLAETIVHSLRERLRQQNGWDKGAEHGHIHHKQDR